jgi:hypothetical protein
MDKMQKEKIQKSKKISSIEKKVKKLVLHLSSREKLLQKKEQNKHKTEEEEEEEALDLDFERRRERAVACVCACVCVCVCFKTLISVCARVFFLFV